MPPTTIPTASPVASWRQRAETVIYVLRNASHQLRELLSVPDAPAAERLSLLLDLRAALQIPSPSLSVNLQDGLVGWARAAATAAQPAELQEDLRAFVFRLDSAICDDLRAGASDVRVIRSADFQGGLLASVGLADEPFTPLDSTRNYEVQTGTGTGYTQFLAHGLQAHLPADHHLRAALPADQLIRLPQGPAYFLGAGDLAFADNGLPYGKPRAYYMIADIVSATQARSARQAADDRSRADMEAWQKQQRLNSQELARTPEQERAEQERRQLEERLAAAERELAELRRHGVGR
jgi:hypothetical protein